MQHAVIYKGPSLLDNKPIVVIATYSNRNTKTGHVVQTYILRSDINPLEASKTGADFSMCGSCPMRGEVTTDPKRKIAKGRKCYVNLGQGVLIVWKSYKRGVYSEGDPRTMGRGPVLRLGSVIVRVRNLDRVHPPKTMASGYRNAKRGFTRGSNRTLEGGPPHISSHRGSWRH